MPVRVGHFPGSIKEEEIIHQEWPKACWRRSENGREADDNNWYGTGRLL